MNRSLFFLLVACVVLSVPVGVRAQKRGAATGPPAEFKLPGWLAWDEVPKGYEPETYIPHDLYGQFYPIGFSREGLFAYGFAPPDEACGCYFFDLYIVDLTTDKEVYRFDYNGDTYAYDNGLEMDDTLVSPWSVHGIWRVFGDSLENQLAKHEIYAGKYTWWDVDKNCQPDEHGYKVETYELNERHAYESLFNEIEGYRVQFFSPSSCKKKTVRDWHVRKEKYGAFIFSVDVIGALKSPFEDRIALLIEEEHRGWEGPPNPHLLKVAGAHLRKGFR